MQMLEIVLSSGDPRQATESLTLVFELRRRARLRAKLDNGQEIGLLLDRGLALKEGDRLGTRDGSLVVTIKARPELLSTVETEDQHLLARAAYHLGNRHVPLQLEPGRLAYQHDHVLDGLMAELGLAVKVLERPFEPEPGGYAAGGHRHEGAEGPRGQGVEGANHHHHHHHHHHDDHDHDHDHDHHHRHHHSHDHD